MIAIPYVWSEYHVADAIQTRDPDAGGPTLAEEPDGLEWDADESLESVDTLFEIQARARPGAVAAVFGDDAITYGQLNQRAGQLAERLRAAGVGPDVLVAIGVERSIAMVVALLAVWKAGGAYVPLDLTHPKERLASVLADARARVLLTLAELEPRLPAHDAKVIFVEPQDGFQAIPRLLPRGEARSSRDLAYVIYTSGSTGQPKGVQVSHGALVNFLNSMQRSPGLAATDTLLAVTTLAFDIAGLELFLPLTVGARVVIASSEAARDGQRLLALMENCGPTVMQATPTTWRLLLEAGWKGAPQLKILCGGEAWPPELAAELLPRCQSLWNMYGPTETTIWSAVAKIEAGDPVAIGPPIANTTFHVLTDRGEPAPPGTPGELHIGGEGVARGYLNRPELTRERFVVDPFRKRSGARLYKTGDLVRALPHGKLEFLGRIDHQIKIRGFRIELGEIECALRQHPTVLDAVVTAREIAPNDRRLIAYTIGRERQPAPAAELRPFLKSKLPEYMQPAAFVELAAFPLTPNGKVDRNALPAPDAGSFAPDREPLVPHSPMEEALAQIWREILAVDQIGLNDSFFECGGHSLLAIRAVGRIRDIFQVEISLRDFFEAPTLGAMVAQIDRARSVDPLRQPEAIAPASRGEAVPLSFAQERLWFLDQLEPDRAIYNMPMAFRIEGPLDASLLERCLAEVVRRHESLRTRFATIDGRAVQVLAPSVSVEWQVIDLAGFSPSERLAEARRHCGWEAQRPFDLEREFPLRAQLFRAAGDEHLLFLNLHHIVTDDWSMGVLLRELTALYDAFSAGLPSPLPALPIQYADFAIWQRNWLEREGLEEQLAYWRRQLEGAPALLELPAARSRPAVASHRGALESAFLPQEIVRGLQALGQREGVTLFMTLLAAFQTLLSRCSGQEDIVVGSPIAGRNRTELEGLIGFFVNTLVFRTDLSGNPTFRQLLRKVREVTLGAFAHQDLPFEKIVEALAPERDPSYAPLCQVIFAWQQLPAAATAGNGLKLSSEWIPTGTSKFDLSLSMVESPAGLQAVVEYSTDLFDRETIVLLLERFQLLLEGIVACPDQRIGMLPFLKSEERQQLLVEWNQTEVPDPAAGCFHELFEAQQKKTPLAIAVAYRDQQMTYRELNARANQLAHYLRKAGVGPEILVGICLPRSIEMIVALLAIFKAGGAVVPLDPSYPKARLSQMIADAGLPLLITQQTLWQKIGATSPRGIFLDLEREQISTEPTRNLDSGVRADHLAYVIYTSGSSGEPNGVLVEHRGLGNVSAAQVRTFALQPDDRVLQFASLCFDAAMFEIVMALRVGASLYLGDSVELMPGPDLARFLEEKAITAVTLPPSALAALPRARYPELRLITVAGEACPPELVAQWAPGRRFFNLYGPTETTIWATLAQCLPESRPPPIGRPIANTAVYVLDRYRNPVPAGVSGELYIGGAGVARGYLNRPDLTADRFVASPFDPQSDARLYKTGDLVRYRPNGDLEFLGRTDHQAKIRGFRIELGEIESALRSYSGVRAAVVVAREDTPGDKRLVAYLELASDAAPTIGELHTFLRQKLPDYMIPSAFALLDAMPLTTNGKIDRRALPAPDLAVQPGHGTYVAPASWLEQRMAQIWVELLGVERVGVEHNFFELGGHSLLAIRLISRLHEELQIEFPLRLLFENQTVRALAKCLEELGATGRDQRRQESLGQQKFHSLVTIQRGDASRRPFFLVPGGWGGEAEFLVYAQLSRQLDPSLPVYGLTARDCEAAAPRYRSVAQMAKAYVDEIRVRQPQGPYLLGGECVGGIVAYEIARLFSGAGEKVDLLVLLDTERPSRAALRAFHARERLARWAAFWEVRIWQPAREHLEKLSRLSFDQKIQYIWQRVVRPRRGPSPSSFFGEWRRLTQYPELLISHRLQRYAGKVTLLIDEHCHRQSNRLGWDSIDIPELEVHVVPGDHVSYIREHAASVAAKLRELIARADDLGLDAPENCPLASLQRKRA